jgi:hypothetical protein
MLEPNFYLSPSDYGALVKSGEWRINDISLDIASGIRRHFGNPSSFALFSSGLSPEAAAANPQTLVAGMDWVRAEDNPKEREPELNVYHYLIGSSGRLGYPVYDCGHSGVLTPSGWTTLEDLQIYLG